MKIGTLRDDTPDETGMILPEVGNHDFDDYAGPFLRLLAAFIDLIFGGMIYAFSVFVRGTILLQPIPYLTSQPAWVLDSNGLPTPDSFVLVALIELVSMLLVYLLYTAISTGSVWQATPGMRIIGIYVASIDGYPIGRARALARTLCCWVSILPLGLGLLLTLIGDKSALHDVICRTRVLIGRE